MRKKDCTIGRCVKSKGRVIMAKKFTKIEFESFLFQTMNRFQIFLLKLFDSQNKQHQKRASLMTYWINDYINYQRNEDNFVPSRLPQFDRGSIVQVHFGYRIGNELGGLHYAVVLDNRNNKNSGIVTVVPLTSIKDTTNLSQNSPYVVQLQRGVYDLMQEKCSISLAQAMAKVEKHQILLKKLENIELEYKSINEYREDYKSKINIQTIAEECKLQEDECNRIVEQATQHMKELEQLKKGSLVNLGQITTISKQRISNPKMVSDSLYKIKLCAEDLEIINQKLKKLYIHE